MKTIVGSYGTATRRLQSAAEFEMLTSDVLALSGVDGLEIPYFGPASPWQDPSYLTGTGSHVLTMVPAMMAGLDATPALGLASIDESSRRLAVDVVREAHSFVETVNAASGGVIETVQLHSSPGRHLSSADAFSRSLGEIRSWDWRGIALAIEHCDADSQEHEPEKGFLSLDQELRVASDHGVGTVINWGRSVIETRTVDGAADHIAAAAAAGVLAGVIFSGCAAVENSYGSPFADRHVPIRDWGSGPLSDAAESSLLTADELERCVEIAVEAPGLRYLGIKVKAPPIARSDQWTDVIAGNLHVLQRAVDRVGMTRSG